MGVTAVIGAAAAVITAGAAVVGAVNQNTSNKNSNSIAQDQLDISKRTYATNLSGQISGYESQITGLRGQQAINDTSIRQITADIEGIDRWFVKRDEFGNIDDENGVTDWDRHYSAEIAKQQSQITGIQMNAANAANTASNQIAQYDRWLGNYGDMYAQQVQSKQASIDSMTANRQAHVNSANNEVAQYDRWLDNYGDMYAQQVQSKQAQTDTLVASGKETYENFLNAIGYADAAAGASGRVGAGTSASHITSMLDRKLVDYVGEDRTLDEHGGLFGSQLTAANMEMGQLKANLERQRMDVLGNKKTILDNLAITGWAYESQMKAAGMEMQQTKAQLEMQYQNVLGDRSTTAANAANAQTAYSAQLDAANQGMGQLEIDLRNTYDDMMKNKDIWGESLTELSNANKTIDDSIEKAQKEADTLKTEGYNFTTKEGLTDLQDLFV
jgi:hypothetical protein